MKTLHDYPKGALRTLDQFRAALDGVVYRVHGIGSASGLAEIHLRDGGTIQRNNIGSVFCYYRRESKVYPYNTALAEFSLLDCNIPANRYNDNFIFTDKSDAEAYLLYARDKTSEPPVLRWIWPGPGC